MPRASVSDYLESLQNLQQLDYRWWLTGSTESADVAVPLILEATNALSVADVGCGLGQWLAVFKRLGVEDMLGYDGPWIDRSQLFVAPPEFVGADLNEPLPVLRRFARSIRRSPEEFKSAPARSGESGRWYPRRRGL